MLKIEKRYLFCIREQISKEFDSFFIFLATLGMYTCENLEIIELPKKTMIDQAKKVLRNDMAENISQSKIVIGYDTYIRKRVVIDNIYRIAIKYGCILEKFDDISFKREEVVSVNLNTIPFFELKITDWSLERRQIFSSSYYSTRARKNGYKRSYENDIIYNYYKCYICKKMTILNVDSEVEYFIQSMLERQFAGENMFHLLVRYASLPDYKLADLASYSYSVYLLLYIELLILLFVDKKIYKICNLKDIKKNMFGANIISDEEFEQTIKICFPEEQGKSLKTEFYKIENGIVLGCWMFNSDLLIIEKVNDLVFNIKQNVMLGKDVDTFGKKILEKIVKEIANRNDWKTVKSNIQIKSTDFDLIAFKEGNVILGQVIFATIQTLSKEENLHRYEKNAFDAIVIDEAHHSAANSYKKVLDYFEPKLWLGMTATPDKRDDNLEGRNIYEIFNHQIAYEIRLQDAMEEDLLCPFHYFGITDLDIIADAGKSSEEKVENFRYLTSEERVENVMKQAEYFGYSGDRVKGLIFCSRIDEAKELSKKFNAKGWRTLVLSGSDSEETRAAAIERLAGEESEDALDYIISVDIFSEGVDVPEINQVIMLRPTESPIVFIQQLGRGLRKAENKEYVVVLDFIGNYRNNFMIPIALSGDRSYNKDNIRRYVTEGGRVIPGASTIHFDEISRKRIFQAIDNANFSDIKLIRENYTNLKNKLGHIPALADFDKYGEMDVLRIFDNNSLGSYYKFLVKYEKEYTIRLSEDEEKVIEFISKKLASGKRIHELELLKRTLQYRHGIIGRLRKHLSEKYHCEMDEHCTENVINMMTNEFPTSAAKKTYAQCVFLKKEQDDYGISDVYGKMLENPEFCAILEELVDFGISRYKVNYSYQYQDTNLVLYQKYTYEDACRLLNWERNEVPLNIGGYKYDKKTKTFPIFINYDKQDNISDTTKYEDHFVAENRLIAISKSGRSMDSEDVQNFLNATGRGIDVQLFVRKNKDDKISKEFYYLGRVIATGNAKQFVMPNTDKTAVEIEWELETPVREDIYQYIVNE